MLIDYFVSLHIIPKSIFIVFRQMKYKNAALICVIALVELGTVLMCIAMHNFSLALLAAIIYVPVILPIIPKQNFTK